MPTLVQLSDDRPMAQLISRAVPVMTSNRYTVETIETREPEEAIPRYQTTTSVDIVVVDCPRDVARIIREVAAHVTLRNARLIIITGRASHYQDFRSEKIFIGDKLNHFRSIQTLVCGGTLNELQSRHRRKSHTTS